MPYGTINADLMTTSDAVSSSGLYGFKNRIINGAMMIDQRNAGASVSTDVSLPVDRFVFGKSGSQTFTGQRSTTAPSGFINSVLVTIGTGGATGATDRLTLTQAIEGYNISDLAWGSASASTITISFWVRSSLTGTFGVALRNSATNRSYVASYTINSANTFEQKTITVTGDTSGTWLTDNSAGIYLTWDLGVGSTYNTTAGSWQAGNYFGLTSGTKLSVTSGATFYITGVQLEKGSTATSFDYRPYGTELALCQRYCQYAGSGASGSFDNSATVIQIMEKCVVTMRAAPSGAIYSGVTAAFRSVALDFTAASPALANFLANTSNVGGTSFWTQVSGFTGGTSNAVVTARNNQTANGGNFILLTSEL